MTQANATQSNGPIAWGRYVLLFCVAAWMFILGVLVGRGTAPVHFDTQALQKELAALRDSMVKKERETVEKAMRGEDEKGSLGFYEALKKDGPDTTVHARQRSAATPRQTAHPPHKTRAGVMAKKKNVVVKSATPTTATKKERTTSVQRGKLTIQVASMKDAEAAQGIVAKLKKDGYPAYLSRHVAAGKGIWFRVRIGQYMDKSQAAPDMARLTRDRKNPILVEAETD
jgi:DedD protein